MSNRLLTQVIDDLDPAKLRDAIKALPPWKSERTGKSRRVPVVNIKPMLMVIADKTNDDAPQKGMWYSQPHIARMTGYSVSQIQQCQYISQSLGVLKVVPRSNKTTGKQTSSMYIVIPEALERFRFPPIAKQGETDFGVTTDRQDTTIATTPHNSCDPMDTTIVTGGHNDCVQTQTLTQIPNPNTEHQVGWIDRGILLTVTTESLATLGSEGCSSPMPTTSINPSCTETENQKAPVSENETKTESPVGKQPTPGSAAPLPPSGLCPHGSEATICYDCKQALKTRQDLKGHDPMTCTLPVKQCKVCSEWATLKSQKEVDAVDALKDLMKRIGGFDATRVGRAALWIYKNHPDPDYSHTEVMEWLVAASNATDNPMYKMKKLKTGMGLVKNWTWVIARYRSYVDSADENARENGKGDGYSNVIAWVAKQLRGGSTGATT
jgi:hypothetical protein